MKALQSKVGSYTTAAQNKSAGTVTTYFLLDEVGARMGQVGKSIHFDGSRANRLIPSPVTALSFESIPVVYRHSRGRQTASSQSPKTTALQVTSSRIQTTSVYRSSRLTTESRIV
eukprot:COSAG02_NODE_4053_length_5848_cov_1.510002_1_plen_115_part_00